MSSDAPTRFSAKLAVALALVVGGLMGCGQRGPLSLPAPAAPASAASAAR